jgi:hypothetical protein
MRMFAITKATMSFVAIAAVTLLAATPASGQVAAPAAHPYGLDPYSPSDAMWLRDFGAALTSQTPLLELTTLDPYKPSEAALIRQAGAAIPLCCPDWYWRGPTFGPLLPSSLPAAPSAMRFSGMRGEKFMVARPTPAPAAEVATAPAPELTPSSMVTLARPQDNIGVSIRYTGQIWTSAGRAVPLQGSTFERVGEYAGSPVYRQTGGNADLIYVQTRDGLIAPFRRRP